MMVITVLPFSLQMTNDSAGRCLCRFRGEAERVVHLVAQPLRLLQVDFNEIEEAGGAFA